MLLLGVIDHDKGVLVGFLGGNGGVALNVILFYLIMFITFCLCSASPTITLAVVDFHQAVSWKWSRLWV